MCDELSAQSAQPPFAVQSNREITETTGPASSVVSSTGEIYVAGTPTWFNWPEPTHSLGDASRIGTAIARLGPSGEPLYVTSIGGAFLRYLVLDGSGNLYVYGLASPSGFVVTPGSYHSTQGNMFICKLRAADGVILFCALFDGSVSAFTFDSAGALYFAGGSPIGIGPTPGAYSYGNRNLAVTKVDSTGSQVLWRAEFSGTSLNDSLMSLAIDSKGNVWMGGTAYSKDFPITPDAMVSEFPSASGFVPPTTGFLGELNASGTSLVYSTFIGGLETFTAMSRDPLGNTYALTSHNELSRIRKFDPTGKTILYDRSMPGATFMFGSSMAVDDLGIVTLLGQTQNVNFPTYQTAQVCGFTEFSPGRSDGVLIRIGTTGDLLESSFLGLNEPVSVSLEPGPFSVQTTKIFVLLWSDTSPDITAPNAVGGPYHLHLLQLQPDEKLAEGLKLACIGSAATLTSAPLVRGEIISLFGSGLGPDTPASAQPGPDNRFPTVLAGTQVTFDGTPVPILYVSATQINAVAPWDISGIAGTKVCALVGNSQSSCILAGTTFAAPGIFSLPSGYAAVVNQDGSVNSPENPAHAGSTIYVYATGLGPVFPTPFDGTIVQLPAPPLSPSVDVFFTRGLASVTGVVLHAGLAPLEVAGLYQIDIKIPSSIPHPPDVAGWKVSISVNLPGGLRVVSPALSIALTP